MTNDEVRGLLVRIVQDAGTFRLAGQWLGLDHADIWRVIMGQTRPGPALLQALSRRHVRRVSARKGHA